MKAIKERTGHTKQWACPMCDELCGSKAEAKTHCIDEIRVAYTCDECDEEFDTAKLAKECCPEWICPACGAGLRDADELCPCEDADTNHGSGGLWGD